MDEYTRGRRHDDLIITPPKHLSVWKYFWSTPYMAKLQTFGLEVIPTQLVEQSGKNSGEHRSSLVVRTASI